MSPVDRVIGALREALLLQDAVKRLADDVRVLTRETRDHDRRLIRLETMVEIAGARASPRRLPKGE